ncbi:MAG: hypothetical protein ACOX5R_00760 [bacterium]
MKTMNYMLIVHLIFLSASFSLYADCPAPMHVFGASDEIRNVDLQVVYYVARDVKPLPDWRERVEYHVRRASRFHEREFGGQSEIHYTISAEPFISSCTALGFPQDDVNNFYWHVINEVWHSGRIQWATGAFPILLVMSDMNFSPGYDDWSRVCSGENCPLDEPHSQCAGWVNSNGEDRPGSRAGGARALLWAEKHIGLGLVTADGWRVPIKGTDCVVYHEGIGHALGLPHPEPINDSVMGLAQYVDSINLTWVDEDQKRTMNWQPHEIDHSSLFSTFEVTHFPTRPSQNVSVTIRAKIPNCFELSSVTMEYQTALRQPFCEMALERISSDDHFVYYQWSLPPSLTGQSIAYRVKAVTSDGESEEIWNYYKVREN